MMLLSCVNCCHNPLQTESLGTSVGYCTEHRKVLLAPSQITCGRHLRKDAEGAPTLSPSALLAWLKRAGNKMVTRALSEARYEKLSAELRQDAPAD